MRTLEQLHERKEELINELSTYKWWGNEDDVDYKEEYGEEYAHLQTELDGVQNQIRKKQNSNFNDSIKHLPIKFQAIIKDSLKYGRIIRSNEKYLLK
jgi:hypothetical protein